MANENSFGICELCGVRKGKAAMMKHVKECLAAIGNKDKLGSVMVLRVSQGSRSIFWLDVAAPVDAKLEQLDDLLRRVWLECCEHLSGFFQGRYDEISMNRRMTEVFGSVGDTVNHQYDFGSTTELTIRLAGLTNASSGKPIVVARNEAPVWPCEECGQPAASVCGECMWRGGGFCCAKHEAEHGCGEEWKC